MSRTFGISWRRALRAAATAAALWLLPGASAAGAQTPPPVSLQLRADKERYVLGEPVYLRARLRNTSTSAVRVKAPVDPRYGQTVVVVTGPGGGRKPFTPLTLVEAELPETVIQRFGQEVAVFPVFFGAEGWTFREPGDYSVQAFWTDPESGGEVASTPVRLRIGEGDGSGARLVASDEASMEAGKFLVWQSGDHLTRGRELLDEVAAANPASPVAQHARLAAANNLSRGFKDYAAMTVRPGGSQEVLDLLAGVSDEALPWHQVAEKRLAEAMAHVRLGQWDEAADRLYDARELADRDAALQELSHTLRRLETVMTNNPQGVAAREKVRQERRP